VNLSLDLLDCRTLPQPTMQQRALASASSTEIMFTDFCMIGRMYRLLFSLNHRRTSRTAHENGNSQLLSQCTDIYASPPKVTLMSNNRSHMNRQTKLRHIIYIYIYISPVVASTYVLIYFYNLTYYFDKLFINKMTASVV
jgi:hypothetical protein